jgi:hypothetical protein
VQLNVYAFLPDVLGGKNAYLDPVAIEREKSLYIGLSRRFGDVPYLAWDLINEPSFGQHLWSAQPNGDSLEAADWNAWLRARYNSSAALEIAWNLPAGGGNGTIAEPSAGEYGGAEGGGPKIHDFYLFEQEKFTAWVATIREAIRSTGSHQLITVGQDEGGNTGRLLPSYFSSAVDFTVNHSWFQSDGLLWNSLVAKQPGKPMLIQEMGVGAGTNPDNTERRSLDDQAALFERKIALSFAQGSGAIEWLWNSNADMLEDGEVALGAFRADKTEKPEADVMRRFATFSKLASSSLLEPQSPDVAIVTSEAAQFSSHWDLEMEAQRNAVRALCYGARVTGSLVGESQVAKLGHPKLVILPSAQALSESTWQALLSYVEDGGTLLVTGPIQRDEHWHLVDRLASAQIGGVVEPLTFRTATLRAGGQSIPLSFSQARQSMLDAVQFKDGSTLAEKSLGKGKILWAAFPVELADNAEAAALLYSLVVQEVGLSPVFEGTASLRPGVLVYPIVLRDELLYIFASEDAADAKIDLRDRLTGASLQFNLPSRHAALVLLRKKDGSVVAKYGY